MDVPARHSARKDGRIAGPALVGVAALLFGLGWGLNFGVSNQNTYLLAGLRLVHPELLTRDWLASHTTQYHWIFAYPAAALLRIDPSGWIFGVMNVLFLALGAVMFFKLLTAIDPRRGRWVAPLLAFVLTLLPALATGTESLGQSTVYNLIFEPLTIAAAGFVIGMYLFAKRRYFWSGLAIALGGVFHANYLILAFPVFFLAHLAIPRGGEGARRFLREHLGRDLLAQFALPFAALVVLLPTILAVATQPDSWGTSVLLSIRSPHHYEPRTFLPSFAPFFGWLILLAAGLRRDEARRSGLDPVLALGASMAVLVLAASALTTIVYVTSVAEMFVWRLAPIAVLVAQMFTARMVTGIVAGDADRPHTAAGRDWLLPGPVRIGAVVVAGGCFVYYYSISSEWTVLEVLAGILVLAILAWGGRRLRAVRRRARVDRPRPGTASAGAAWLRTAAAWPVAGVLALALIALAALSADGVRNDSSLLQPNNSAARLYSWARASTEVDAVFLIPPNMENFRLAAGRAVVVDWKSTPFAPVEVEEWYRRIDALTGRAAPASSVQARDGYDRLPAYRLANLADRYIAQYVVLQHDPATAMPAGWRLVFDYGPYQVFRTAVPIPAS